MLGPNCREVTRRVLLAEETRLSLRERLGVRFHMLICKACPTFAEQLALMRRASARWRRYSEE
ncbi:zf-HC2 domain-containing protein [Paucibacter sp. R3-3]|uniref:Zf-HC2 domain-containing protein n=1 Tax=Roseateles agri TaxID=3098619 RepID=A0ABU5DH28_9BURK|nr:zf-HC2 domain-containing protein [Paucibacter sp. R3-3]MDY0745597.1 zf-HC2 domain-containing protein [Paucibacter sp. R3-3]